MARIAIFDYRIVANNPIGSCHLRMLRELSREHEFTVFAVDFDNPDPDRIEFVRVPAPGRPLAALFACYHLIAPLVYAAYRLRGKPFDAVQMIESNLSFGTISYAHFCHRAYLERHWTHSRPEGLRRALRWLDHRMHAIVEPWIFRRVKSIIVPSQGLACEIGSAYPHAAGKITVLPNAVDVKRMAVPEGFERQELRDELGVAPNEVLLVFVALGQYERKGLPYVLEAMRRIQNPTLKLVVVGGGSDLVKNYRQRAAQMGLASAAIFVGGQANVRPYLWSSDAFVFPSAYEAASLAFYEAAAAGLPLLSCRLNGTDGILEDGKTGIAMDPSADSVSAALRRFMECLPSQRASMGEAARLAALPFDVAGWADRWRALYDRLPRRVRSIHSEVGGDAHVA